MICVTCCAARACTPQRLRSPFWHRQNRCTRCGPCRSYSAWVCKSVVSVVRTPAEQTLKLCVFSCRLPSFHVQAYKSHYGILSFFECIARYTYYFSTECNNNYSHELTYTEKWYKVHSWLRQTFLDKMQMYTSLKKALYSIWCRYVATKLAYRIHSKLRPPFLLVSLATSMGGAYQRVGRLSM